MPKKAAAVAAKPEKKAPAAKPASKKAPETEAVEVVEQHPPIGDGSHLTHTVAPEPDFDREKFEAKHLPTLSVLARTRGEDQVHEQGDIAITVFQDGTYRAATKPVE